MTTITFKISNAKIVLFIKSAFVRYWTAGMVESTKYLFPIAPKIPPTVKLILESNSPTGIRKTIQEIKKDKKEPRNNFKNNQPPDLEITILKFAIG